MQLMPKDMAEQSRAQLSHVTDSMCEMLYEAKNEEPYDVLYVLLSEGCQVAERCVHMGRTPLMLCAQKGWKRSVEALLSHGANPRERDDSGRDALMLALIARRVECAKILAPVSNLRWRDKDGRCALALAALHASHKADKELWEKLWAPGSDRWVDSEGRSALCWVIERNEPTATDWMMGKRVSIEARALGMSMRPVALTARGPTPSTALRI